MKIGVYSLGQNIRDNPHLCEISQLEYTALSKTFVAERILKAPDVFFLGHLWNICIGAIKDRIYKLSAQFESDNGQIADSVYLAAIEFCSNQYGSPLSGKNLPSSLRNLYETSGCTQHEVDSVMMWKTSFGNVILDRRLLLDNYFINFAATSGSVVMGSHQLSHRITPIRTALTIILSTMAAYSFSFAIDLILGWIFMVYPNTALLPAVTWSVIAIVVFIFSIKVASLRSWISIPFVVFGALALLGAFVGTHPHSFGVAATMLIAAVLIWRTDR